MKYKTTETPKSENIFIILIFYNFILWLQGSRNVDTKNVFIFRSSSPFDLYFIEILSGASPKKIR